MIKCESLFVHLSLASLLLQISNENEISLQSGTAVLYPGRLIVRGPLRFASARNAIDGNLPIGNGANYKQEALKCASTSDTPAASKFSLKYLLIDMKRVQYVSCVRLILSKILQRKVSQDGLIVSVSVRDSVTETTRCGNKVYNQSEHGLSPLFACLEHARYIWVISRDTGRPLQICEVKAYSGLMNLTFPGIATLSPGPFSANTRFVNISGFARFAVDGNLPMDQTEPNDFLSSFDCAISAFVPNTKFKFLRISLHHKQLVYIIRLHLRNSLRNYVSSKDQKGLTVALGNSDNVNANRIQCGLPYEEDQGQFPVFFCDANGRYVWLTLNTSRFLWVCEVEVFADVRCIRPPLVANGQYQITNNSICGSLLVICNSGFWLTSTETVVCTSSGNWSRPVPLCIAFNCSMCHKDADCVENANCTCKPGYFGDGRRCCAEDLKERSVVPGESVLLPCDTDCNLQFQRVVWYFNSLSVDISNNKFGVARNGMILYIDNVSKSDAGEYTCEIHNGQTVVRRYTNLQLIEENSCASQPNLVCSSDCGRSCARQPFVARGDITNAGQFPWQAMLCSPTHGHHCGGVLVSDDCIVTAAHCIVPGGVFINNISVCVGRQCGNCSEVDVEGNPQCFKTKSIVIHPNFTRRTLDNDIAVLKLPKAVSCHCNSVFPVCLPNETRDGSHLRAQMEGVVTGWGRVNSSVSRSTCLRKGNVRLASRRICSLRHPNYPITQSMMCATDYNGACEGDSGGPLVVKNRDFGGRYVLAGIVSWGIGCGRTNGLGVYTRVLNHLDWIQEMCSINS